MVFVMLAEIYPCTDPRCLQPHSWPNPATYRDFTPSRGQPPFSCSLPSAAATGQGSPGEVSFLAGILVAIMVRDGLIDLRLGLGFTLVGHYP